MNPAPIADKHVTRNGTIMTSDGKLFDVLDPWNSDINIDVIAHSLAKNDRATGHYWRKWSIADHSVLVSRIANRLALKHLTHIYGSGETDRIKRTASIVSMAALLHDGSEAYLVDLPRPVKYLDGFQAYRVIEFEVQSAIYRRFSADLGAAVYGDIIKKADDMALRYEFWSWLPGARQLDWCTDEDNLEVEMSVCPDEDFFYEVDWRESKERFLREYGKLKKIIEGDRN